MDKLRFIKAGYEDDKILSLLFLGTEFDSVVFQLDNFEIGEDIPDTTDTIMHFEYVVVSDTSGLEMIGEREAAFRNLLAQLVNQIIVEAVKDL